MRERDNLIKNCVFKLNEDFYEHKFANESKSELRCFWELLQKALS